MTPDNWHEILMNEKILELAYETRKGKALQQLVLLIPNWVNALQFQPCLALRSRRQRPSAMGKLWIPRQKSERRPQLGSGHRTDPI